MVTNETNHSGDNNDLPEILYVMGTGRSGSTILDIMLGNNSNVFNGGELNFLVRDGFLHRMDCSCGEAFDTCKIWSAVLKKHTLSESVCLDLITESRRLEWHTGFFPLALGFRKIDWDGTYIRYIKALFRHISEVTEKRIIVDSSKYAGRALLLSRVLPNKVRVIWLTRSPLGLLSSFQKQNIGEQPPKSVASTFLYILYVVLCSWIAFHRLPKNRRIQIRFEDMQNDPTAVIKKIERWSGFNLSQSKDILDRNVLFEVNHILTGNRLRKQGKVPYRKIIIEEETSKRGLRFAEKFLSIYYDILGINKDNRGQ